jgi:formate dehydrogenase major subunit
VALGNGAMSNSISDIENSKCLLVFGYNCADSHPIVARRVIKARENGAKIIVCDPRRIETARIADRHLQLNNGSNMALVNAFGHVLLEEDLYNHDYVERFTEGLDAYREAVKDYSPEAVEAVTGVPAQEIRQAMRMFAAAPSATIMWGMGVTQFGQAVDVVKGLASLALLTGNLGRERRRGPGARAKQRPGRLRYGRAAESVPRLSGGHRSQRARQICRGLGHRPGHNG